MALLDDYHTAWDSFLAAKSQATGDAVVAARGKLPDSVSGEGASTTLPSLEAVRAAVSAVLTTSRATDRRRIINARVGYGR